MSANRIKKIYARQMLDCSARPMVEVDVVTESGLSGRGAAPTGKSVGAHEAFVLRDNDPGEYKGMSVHQAVRNVNEIIAPALIGKPVSEWRALDQIMVELDGTETKSRLGGNAIYSTSIALLRAAAAHENMPVYQYLSGGRIQHLPIPSFNMINGGRNGAIRQAFNEFLVMPYRAKSIYKACEIAVVVFNEVQKVIRDWYKIEPAIGRSYGWVAPTEDPAECFAILQEAIDRGGFTEQCAFGIDCASSEMFDAETGTYYLMGSQVDTAGLIRYVDGLMDKFNFVFIEDLLDEDAWEGYKAAHQALTRTLIIADDFTVSNPARVERAVRDNSIDGFILKPNQVGTITEALDAYDFAISHGLIATPSGRSGGVIDDIVMDLSVGLQVPFQKNGCPRSGERIEKLNFLMRVADSHPGIEMANISHLIKF